MCCVELCSVVCSAESTRVMLCWAVMCWVVQCCVGLCSVVFSAESTRGVLGCSVRWWVVLSCVVLCSVVCSEYCTRVEVGSAACRARVVVTVVGVYDRHQTVAHLTSV